MKSMTGYGRSSFLHEDMEVSVEASSVNKRNLETLVSLPRDWQSLERDILTLTREAVARGRINLTVKARAAKTEIVEASWDEKRLREDLEHLRAFAEKEGIFAGGSTGLNVVAAIEIAKEIGPGKRVLTLNCDDGLKYLGSHIYD